MYYIQPDFSDAFNRNIFINARPHILIIYCDVAENVFNDSTF